MGRLINADELKENINGWYDFMREIKHVPNFTLGQEDIIAKIDNQPTVNTDFKEITLNYKGMTRSALYDPHREMIFTDYMTTEYAKSMGYTWKEKINEP